jgi:ABC-type nickel/cobalt efflux system permease component RcnA
MILKRQIVLKAVVTEKLKEELIQGVEEAMGRVEQSQEELERQSRRLMLELQRTDLNRAMAYRQQLDAEKRKHEEVKTALQDQLQEYQNLQLGDEFTRGTLEGDVEVKVGDNIEEKLGFAEILVEDDLVKELRDPAVRPSDAPDHAHAHTHTHGQHGHAHDH